MPQITLKKHLTLLILLFNLIIIAKCYSYDLKILYPNKIQYTYTQNIHLVMKQSESIHPYVYLNGKKIENKFKIIKQTTTDGTFYIFMIKLKLIKGKNIIEVSSQSYIETLTVNFLKFKSEDKNQNNLFHMNEKAVFCKKCHDFTKTDDCMLCHTEKKMGKYVHGPVAMWQCSVCHDKNNFFTVLQPLSVKCLQCHQEFSEAMYYAKYAHPPSIAGNCLLCHSPHNSNNKFFLLENSNKICSNCHIDKITGFHILHKKNKHHQKFKCILCHNPHYGESRYLFVKKIKTRKALCAKCH